ncbi:MAG: pyrimidine-nucleoside phosphorylase [Eubacterium sp.]|jgi:pyrimidine-nucleoside phosphorylase|nr:pyrimidine-nucleoside phosphorylase [Eubacterium sp.]
MQTGRFVDLIHKKKEGKPLEPQEIRDMVSRYAEGKIPDYQMSAMLMAICFQGMDDEELTALTLAMRDSGETADLSGIPGIKVDKHSTGGVGDKTTLIVGPLVAACGVPVAKMSGRGLGFTGGTLDKLESIPGFCIDLTEEEFFRAVRASGISVIGQTGNLAPADKKLYALRDVTGTVESIPLIASSIMSKKLAAGSDKILLDVTTGSGAFIKDLEQSRELARRMTAIGRGAGRETVAMLTSMEEPLGFAVGNNLEVKEAIKTLRGEGPEDLREICLALAGMMLSLGKEGLSYKEGRSLAEETLDSGAAYGKFLDMVEGQGGDLSYIENMDKFQRAACERELTAGEEGYISSMDTEGIGITAGILGAGRETKESVIDHSAGIVMKKKIGDWVRRGDAIAVLYSSSEEKLDRAERCMQRCYTISDRRPEPLKLVVDIIR